MMIYDDTNIGLTLEIAAIVKLCRLDETVGSAVGEDRSHGGTEGLHSGSQGSNPDLAEKH